MTVEEKLNQIEQLYQGKITSIEDLTAGERPTFLFFYLAKKLSYVLSNDPDFIYDTKAMVLKDKVNTIVQKLGPLLLKSKQVFEDRNVLTGTSNYSKEVVLPSEPVIFSPNHGFHDDITASILAAKRNAYILFGSVPHFYNSIDGLMLNAKGVILVNRKVKESRTSSIGRTTKLLKAGKDVMVFPEGIWNKSPNALVLDLWPGIYRIYQETGAKIVPIVHYKADLAHDFKGNDIHTVVDDPISFDGMTEKEALSYLRDIMATWTYLMMEKYGKTTKEELLGNRTPDEYWRKSLEDRISSAVRYDKEIELSGDYIPKDRVNPEDVFAPIANIGNITPENISDILEAKRLVLSRKENNYQRLF